METLIILFIIYSIFQWLFSDNKNKKKKREQRAQQGAGTEDQRWDNEQPKSWEEAMGELESIFTGGTPEKKQKSEPQPLVSDAQARESFSADPFSDDLTTSSRSLKNSGADILKELEEDESNPIYSGGSVSDDVYGSNTGVTSGDARILLEEINSPESLRRAIIIKEILDKPRAYRRHDRVF